MSPSQVWLVSNEVDATRTVSMACATLALLNRMVMPNGFNRSNTHTHTRLVPLSHAHLLRTSTRPNDTRTFTCGACASSGELRMAKPRALSHGLRPPPPPWPPLGCDLIRSIAQALFRWHFRIISHDTRTIYFGGSLSPGLPGKWC